MKNLKFLLIAVLVMFISDHSVFAQKTESEKDFRFTVKTNPLSALGGPFWIVIVPITGEYKALFEARVSNKSSFQIGAGYLGPSVLLNLDELTKDESEGEVSGIKTNGFRVQAMYKIFLSRDLKAPEGFYVGPHASFANAKIKDKVNEVNNINATKLNLNGVFGYQLITSGGFTLDIFTGIGFVSRKWEISGTDWDNESLKDKASINVPFGFSFGYAF